MPTGSSLLTLWLAGFDKQNQLQVLPLECQRIEDMDTGEWVDGVIYVNKPTPLSDELMGIIKRSGKHRVHIIKRFLPGRPAFWDAGDSCAVEETQKAALEALLRVVRKVQDERRRLVAESEDHASQVLAAITKTEPIHG